MPRASAQLSFQLDKRVYNLSTRNVSLRVNIKQADAANVVALGNESYWDPPQAIHHIQATIYAKRQGVGAITASLVNNDTGQTFATVKSEPIVGDWRIPSTAWHWSRCPSFPFESPCSEL